MSLTKRNFWVLVLVAILAIGGIVSAIVLNQASAEVIPGNIDDGEDLLPQASITLEEAIAAAQAAESGALGEVDLEYYEGALVFNVDIGEWDVKVDASDGTVLGKESDD
ncbi:PepSY domain-containing protein [Chloroflexota bacterium]